MSSEEWVRPLEGWWKFNFDGASKGNHGPSGEGVIVWDWKGEVIALGAQKLDEGTNNIAEASTTLLVVRIGKMLGVRKLNLEGDSLIVIQAIVKGSIEVRHLQNQINSIIEELKCFNDYKVSHVTQTWNVEVDILFKWALSFNVNGDLKIEYFRQALFEEE
ncbi:uncharacterized protein LOC131059776 [Cryptomeria japonica]|uniref:uncharacterized protein LOC131059776 n=1 Tax=Cryptomeria japonica TaxID=3369 RepID=UPI0027D9F1A0|nr:uncharacterized protein LOC131059776 [Cryptomeria japonica]